MICTEKTKYEYGQYDLTTGDGTEEDKFVKIIETLLKNSKFRAKSGAGKDASSNSYCVRV